MEPKALFDGHPLHKLLPVIAGIALAIAAALALKTSAQAYDLDSNNCLACHSSPSLSKQNGQGSVSLFVSANELTASAHRYLDCTSCHTDKPHQVQTPLTKQSLAQKCGTCHAYEYKLHLTSIHGQKLSNGNSDVATCTDCHSADSNPHSVVRVLEPTASTYPKNIAQTCAKCHNNPQLMSKYGIVEKVYESYMRSFHGKAMKLASDKLAVELLNKATCTNCHGTHDIMEVNDPGAPVAGMANLAKTCEQCHPGAGVTFASGFLGHKEANPSFLPPVYWGERFFYIFTRAVLAVGGLMVSFEIGRWGVGHIAARIRRSREQDD